MKNNVLFLLVTLLVGNYCISQNTIILSSGESPIHKKSDNAKALNEAIMDAQINAVIAYGGNINVHSLTETENLTESKKGKKDKKYKNSGSFSSSNSFLLQNSVSAMVKNIEIKADTVWISKNKFKVRVNGKFDVNLKDLGTHITDYLNCSNRKIKIEIIENDCFGQIYKPMSVYVNSKRNNFLFSNQAWLLGEGDYKIEINTNHAVLYDKRFIPNVIIKIYSYNNCQSLIDNLDKGNIILDEMINDIYAVYIYKSVK